MRSRFTELARVTSMRFAAQEEEESLSRQRDRMNIKPTSVINTLALPAVSDENVVSA